MPTNLSDVFMLFIFFSTDKVFVGKAGQTI